MTQGRRIAPYGTWPSPVGAEDVARHGGAAGAVQRHGDSTWWSEALPAEGGRVTVRRLADRTAAPVEVLPAPWSARNRVHEYGGTAYTVVGDVLVFTEWSDQRVYAVVEGAQPRPLTPAPERAHGVRYTLGPAAAPTEVWAVRETVTGERPTDVRRDLVAISLEDGEARPLAASHHFLTVPVPSPDGRHAAWIGWNHPAMPWDGTELCVAELGAAGFGPHRVVAGGPDEAVVQVAWDGDGLLAVTDPDDWWNLYRVPLDGGSPRNLAPVERELGGAMWQLGSRWVTPVGGGRHVVEAAGELCVLDEHAATVTPVQLAEPLVEWSGGVAVDGMRVFGVAGRPDREGGVLSADIGTGAVTWLAGSGRELPDPAWLARPERRTVAGVPVVYHPPTSPAYAAPEGSAPPLLVHVHGGPTNRNPALPDIELAYFTSRGFAVVAPDYGGSTGHGRTWRNRLRERWGVVDVDDCAAVALELAEQGLADRDRLVVRGGSAGGWTTAASLAALPPDGVRPVYACGTSRYPVLDLLSWATRQTHDFESQYLQSLVGPLPATETRYRERSPSSHPQRLTGPILLLQGLDDRICPPVQAERFVAELAGSGIPHAYLAFEGEQHGFRRAETIVAAMRAELGFYARVLGLPIAGVEPMELRR